MLRDAQHDNFEFFTPSLWFSAIRAAERPRRIAPAARFAPQTRADYHRNVQARFSIPLMSSSRRQTPATSVFARSGVPAVRRLLLACAVLALAAFPAALQAEEFHRTERYTVRMFSFGTLTMNTRMGDVDVEGWDNPRLSVEAEKLVRAGSRKKADRLYRRFQVQLQGQDHRITLSTSYPRRRLWRPFRDESKLTVNFTIRMPYDSNLSLKCDDGDVTVSGITGREILHVNYGDVEIDVPSVYRLRLLDARTWLGYVQSDLHGMPNDSAGFARALSFINPNGTQVIVVHVRMGGVFVYGDEGY